MKKLHIRRPVWRGPRLSRKARTVRNLTLSALAAAVLYAALGFPPYTVNGTVDSSGINTKERAKFGQLLFLRTG